MYACVHAQLLSCISLFVTPWTVTYKISLSMGFPSQEYWSGLPFPPLLDLLHSGIKPESPALAGGFFTTESPGKPPTSHQFSSVQSLSRV